MARTEKLVFLTKKGVINMLLESPCFSGVSGYFEKERFEQIVENIKGVNTANKISVGLNFCFRSFPSDQSFFSQ